MGFHRIKTKFCGHGYEFHNRSRISADSSCQARAQSRGMNDLTSSRLLVHLLLLLSSPSTEDCCCRMERALWTSFRSSCSRTANVRRATWRYIQRSNNIVLILVQICEECNRGQVDSIAYQRQSGGSSALLLVFPMSLLTTLSNHLVALFYIFK